MLPRASRAAAREIDELTPAAGLNELNADLAERYRRWAAALDREVLRSPSRRRRSATWYASTGKPPTSCTSKS